MCGLAVVTIDASAHIGDCVAHMPERRTYRAPPIVEAVCEVRYHGGVWDPTIPGRMQERLADRYDGTPREQNLLQAGVRHLDSPEGSGIEVQGRQHSRIQLQDTSQTRIISVAENVLSISDLAPYSGWRNFYGRIEQAVSMYHNLASPVSVTRIGVRYINRVLATANVNDIGEYFYVTPQMPPRLNMAMRTFLARSESQYHDGPRLTVTFASSEQEHGKSEFILDLDVYIALEFKANIKTTLTSIVDLRDRERVAFEHSITDKARDFFDDKD